MGSLRHRGDLKGVEKRAVRNKQLFLLRRQIPHPADGLPP
jgi:hypothetical protein